MAKEAGFRATSIRSCLGRLARSVAVSMLTTGMDTRERGLEALIAPMYLTPPDLPRPLHVHTRLTLTLWVRLGAQGHMILDVLPPFLQLHVVGIDARSPVAEMMKHSVSRHSTMVMLPGYSVRIEYLASAP